MSLIGKKPFVQEVLDSLSAAELAALQSLVDNLGTATLVSLVPEDSDYLSNAHKGVRYVSMKLNAFPGERVHGILCYKDADHCGLFSFQDSLEYMRTYKINPSTNTSVFLQEHLSADEFRRVIDDSLEDESGEKADLAWVNIMKEKLVYNSETNTIEDGVGLEVDGDLTVNSETKLNDHFSIFSGSDRIVDVNTDNKATSIYGSFKVGSAETPTNSTFNGDVNVGASGDSRKILLNGSELKGVPDNTGFAGMFLKAGSSGPVWAEPVTGTNDGTNWTSLSVQTASGIKTYSIPSGGSGTGKYAHFIQEEDIGCVGLIISDSSAPYTNATLASWLYTNNYTGVNDALRIVSGSPRGVGTNLKALDGLYSEDGSTLSFKLFSFGWIVSEGVVSLSETLEGFNVERTISDTVVPL